MIEELVSRVFATRNAVHLAHWKTNSFAKHSALGDLYEGLIEQIDKCVEIYQGANELIEKPKPRNVDPDDIVKHLEAEAEWIEANMDELSGGVRALENVLQDLSGTYYHALYKLRFLS